jgi:hypothetical protein
MAADGFDDLGSNPMTTPRRWPTAVRRTLAVLAGGALMALTGCANDRDARLSQLGRGRDPLLGEKIPSPNVPTGRDQYGSKNAGDPLLRADAGRGGYEPLSRDGANEPLRIPDRRPGGAVASRGLTLGSTATQDQLTAELQQAGAKLYGPSRTETGSYEVRVMVPNGGSGAMSGFVGGGATPTAALRDAYDQVRAGWR